MYIIQLFVQEFSLIFNVFIPFFPQLMIPEYSNVEERKVSSIKLNIFN
jgi:hypothetical protein